MADRSKGRHFALRSVIAIAFLAACLPVAGCSSTIGFDDPSADYLQRTALVSTSGGDAQAANIAMQTATPWPRYSNDTNIPANGARIVKAINALRKRLRGRGRERQRDAERGESGRERRRRSAERRLHRNDGFSSRSILRLLERRRFLSMPEGAPAKARSFWRDEEGSALVEATIVMPLLLSLFLGVFEFSWFFYNQQLVVSGLRDAARYMTRIELTDGNRDPCAQKDQNGLLYTDGRSEYSDHGCKPRAARRASAAGARPMSPSVVRRAPRSITETTPTARQP